MVAFTQQILQNCRVGILWPACDAVAIGSAVAHTGDPDLAFFGFGGISHAGHAVEVQISKTAADQ